MLTFLPFLRAVKTPAGTLWVCTLISSVGVSCTRALPAPVSSALGPATGPVASAPPVSTAEPTLTPSAETTVGAPPGAASVPAPGGELSVELPYPSDARPRASDAEAAAIEDEALARWNLGGSSDSNAAANQASFHPGTRVVVDTRPAKLRTGVVRRSPNKGLTFDRVQAQARSHGYWPFRLCFEAGQRDKPGTGGETKVAFSVGVRGKVTATRLLDSKLGNPSTAACLVKELQKLEFTPRPAQKLAMVASIRIYPGDAEATPSLEASAPPPALTPAGSFDAQVMRSKVLEKQSTLAACFAEAQRADPALWGRLALSVILEIDGSVHRITEVESHFPNAAASRCAAATVAGIVFPSVNGKPFTFVVPLRLTPLAGGPETTRPGPEQAPSPAEMPETTDD